jgi:hypothetical protein
MLLDQSRYNLSRSLSMFRLRRSAGTRSDGALPPMSTADLARSLHTDRGNLSRQIAKAETRYPVPGPR